jgi:hypothetical protein
MPYRRRDSSGFHDVLLEMNVFTDTCDAVGPTNHSFSSRVRPIKSLQKL